MTALARNTDPSTSHTAASMAKELVAHHHEMIVEALELDGAMGVDRIAGICRYVLFYDRPVQITGHQVGKRMNELEKAGRVELTGRTVTSFSGRPQSEWQAVKANTATQ